MQGCHNRQNKRLHQGILDNSSAQNTFVEMAPVSSAIRSNREKRRAENQEDIKHLLGGVWDFDPDETFHKIFSRESKKGVQEVIDISKEELKELRCREDNGDLSDLIAS